MKTINSIIEERIKQAFVQAGIDESYGRVGLSNRPDLCEYQCNGCLAAAKALAGLISDDELNAEYILPDAFDPRVGKAVAAAVAQAAKDTGVARL